MTASKAGPCSKQMAFAQQNRERNLRRRPGAGSCSLVKIPELLTVRRTYAGPISLAKAGLALHDRYMPVNHGNNHERTFASYAAIIAGIGPPIP